MLLKYPFYWVYRRKLGAIRLKRFVAMIYKLLQEEEKQFDVVLVGGNSGLMMGRITEKIFDQLNIKRPTLIAIPFVRYDSEKEESIGNFIDNSDFQDEIRDQLRNTNDNDVKNVLFVDDEIGNGCTAEGCIKALLKATGTDNRSINYFIVAEDHGFKASSITSAKVFYHPFAVKITGLNNVICHCIPNVIDRKIRKILPDAVYHSKRRLNVLLDLPSRDKKHPASGYNYQLNEKVRQYIPNLEELKEDFMVFLSKLITDGIEEYKNGKIYFSDDK